MRRKISESSDVNGDEVAHSFHDDSYIAEDVSGGGQMDDDPLALIDALYTLSDITAEINGQTTMERIGLVAPDDVGLIDDIIDALQDPQHGQHARSVLRKAVAEISRHAIGELD